MTNEIDYTEKLEAYSDIADVFDKRGNLREKLENTKKEYIKELDALHKKYGAALDELEKEVSQVDKEIKDFLSKRDVTDINKDMGEGKDG